MKTYFALGAILFDVAIFPFGCSPKRHLVENYVIFDSIYQIEDIMIGDVVSARLPESHKIVLEDYSLTYEISNYQITYWSLLQDDKVISFPYTYSEEDLVPYYQGYRNSLVFVAHWEKINE